MEVYTFSLHLAYSNNSGGRGPYVPCASRFNLKYKKEINIMTIKELIIELSKSKSTSIVKVFNYEAGDYLPINSIKSDSQGDILLDNLDDVN
jgi:hypothetical protein